jgi:hypothetical protein
MAKAKTPNPLQQTLTPDDDFADFHNTVPWTGGGEILPAGLFKAILVELSDGFSKGSDDGTKAAKRMLTGQFSVLEPASYAQANINDYYVVAQDALPSRYDASTIGARRLRALLDKGNIPFGNSINEVVMRARNVPVILDISCEDEEYTDNQGQQKTRQRNRIRGYFAVGERQPAIREGVATPVAATAAKPAPVTTPARPAMPAMSQQQQQQAPGMPKMPQQMQYAPPPIHPYPQAPVVQPQTAPVPHFTATAPAAGPTIPCVICNQQVPINDWQVHTQAHVNSFGGPTMPPREA